VTLPIIGFESIEIVKNRLLLLKEREHGARCSAVVPIENHVAYNSHYFPKSLWIPELVVGMFTVVIRSVSRVIDRTEKEQYHEFDMEVVLA
jgi:hypothetical protein